MTTQAPEAVPSDAAVSGIPFTVASRPQRRFSNGQTVSNLAAGGSFQIVQLPATGWVRGVALLFSATYTTSASAAVVAGDAPFNLIANVTLTDATGQPVMQPISGYNLYLVNKYFGANESYNAVTFNVNPQLSPEYAYTASATAGSATWRVDIDFEVDTKTGYGCIPNLDSNASLQLKVDYAVTTVAFSGGTASAATVSMRVSQKYWAPVGSSLGGAPVQNQPPGAGDYVETRYETQPVSASSENLVALTNRGGLVKGVLLISRAAGVRTAITAATNLGILLDNQPIYEGIPIEEHYDEHRRMYGYFGADLTTSYAPLAAGVMAGADRGVVPISFFAMSGGRDPWLNTRNGSLFQIKVTPGAAATQLEIVTQLMQAKSPEAFYNAGA